MEKNNPGTLLLNPDVLVVGGGSAGIAAAVAAGEQGASVVLLEKNSYAGGKATAAYVGTICGMYYRSENPVSRFVHKGFPMQFCEELAQRSNSKPVKYNHGLHFLPYDNFSFILLCDEWLKKSASQIFFHTLVCDAVTEDNSIQSVRAMVDNRLVNFHPRTVIDTTGENLVASLLQLDSIKSDRYQAASQVFRLSGILESDFSVLNMAMLRVIKKAVTEKILDAFFERVSLVPGSLFQNSVLLKLPLPITIENEINQVTSLELFSRNAVEKLVKFLKVNCEPFHTSQLTFVAPEAGTRTGPRNLGKQVLSGTDVLAAQKHSDSITRGVWPVEYWEPGQSVRMEYFEMDDYYDIPAGALQSNTISNLFFGGRNISADDKAIASARVIGTCMATGYAAGVMAASKARDKSTTDTILEIQHKLFFAPGE